MFSPNELLLIIALLAVKHFLCDFPLQNIYGNIIIHFKGSRRAGEWVPVLLLHSSIHMIGSGVVLSYLFWNVPNEGNDSLQHRIFLVLALEGMAHFIIDRIKADPSIGGRFKPEQIYFWWALGIDQLLHMLTYVVMLFILIN